MSNIWTGKDAGKKIAIKFTEDLYGDVSGLTPEPVGGYKPAKEPFMPGVGDTYSSSGYYGSYSHDRAFDGSTSTYWRASTTTPPVWIQVDLGEGNEVVAGMFRWYVSSYRPRAFVLQGSNDEANWDTLVDAESPNSSGWHEFEFSDNEMAYRYYRWTISSRWSSYFYVYEIELYGREGIGNEKAFTVKGNVPYPLQHGELQETIFTVASVDRKEGTADTIILTFDWNNRFNDVQGLMTVEYDDTVGNLQGEALAVESFSETFVPEDLEPTPVHEHIITITADDLMVDFKFVTYEIQEFDHTINVEGTELFVDFMHVDEIPP